MLKRFAYAAAVAAIGIVLALAGLKPAQAALASSTGCAFSNGCATLNGFDAASHPVAMDAKHQNDHEIVIGYPDQAGDGATSFDAVLHYTHGRSITTESDTGLAVTGAPDTAYTPPKTTGPAVALDPPITVKLTSTGVDTGLLDVTVSGGTGPYTVTLTGLPAAQLTLATNYGTGTGVPAGDENTATGTIAVAGGTLTPGVYNNLVLTVADSYSYGTPAISAPAVSTTTFAVRVFGDEVTLPGNDAAFYTFVYAPAGRWTSQCVTDVNGSGALRLAACTEGKDPGQDFTVAAGTGLLGNSPVHVSNWLAKAVGPDSCLTDPSTLAPGTPQSDATDEAVSPAGRQLRTDGSCSTAADLWSWNT